MNTSTQGVELLSGFVFDVLSEYQNVRKVCAPAFEIAAGLDANRSDQWCSIDIYNELCTWIEVNVGSSSIRRAGSAIGARVYDNMVAKKMGSSSDPLAMMNALKLLATQVIRDPSGRGWEVDQKDSKTIEMRRTQTFNCVLQEGLLLALVEKTGVLMPSVSHIRCTRRGDDFCDYQVRWLRERKPPSKL